MVLELQYVYLPLNRESEPKICLFILMELCERDTLKHWLYKNRGENSRNRKAMIEYFEQVRSRGTQKHQDCQNNAAVIHPLKSTLHYYCTGDYKLSVVHFVHMV